MKIRFLIVLFSVLFYSKKVSAEGDNDVKRGAFPFMLRFDWPPPPMRLFGEGKQREENLHASDMQAFLYYPDETVVDSTGARFIRGAVIIKPDWLVSSAIDHSVLNNTPLGFPRKTLLARAGAITIDSHLTLNEDEYEQEREVVTIVRPSIHNVESWWLTDINLLNTLLPFNLTSAVAVSSVESKRLFVDKNCVILIYAKRYGNVSEEKVLMQLAVELLPPSMDNCGNQFSSTSMTCAVDGEETKSAIYDPEFCQGNSGGPLLCEGEVMALQTYIENNCRQPHLYQLLSAWNTLIACSIQDKCNQPNCADICSVIHKDNLITRENTSPSTSTVPVSTTNPNEGTEAEGTTETIEPTNTQNAETTTDVSDMPTEMLILDSSEDHETIKPKPTTLHDSTTASTTSSSPFIELTSTSEAENRPWPKERLVESDTKVQTKNDEKDMWNPNVERRMDPPAHLSATGSNASLSLSLVVSICAIKYFF